MSFAWDIHHYSTLQDYLAALLPFKKPSWIKRIVLHHTDIPTRAQWRGLTTMQSLVPFYQGKGWAAGPHLFLAALTPGPFTDGIWSGTPLTTPGVHAGACNPDGIGVEIVGNYDHEPWPLAVAELVYGVTIALMQWGDIAPANVLGHRECLPNKTCPGAMIHMDQVRAELRRRLSAPPLPPPAAPHTWKLKGLPIYHRQDLTGAVAGYITDDTPQAIDILYPNRAGHLMDERGFVDMNGLEAL